MLSLSYLKLVFVVIYGLIKVQHCAQNMTKDGDVHKYSTQYLLIYVVLSLQLLPELSLDLIRTVTQ